MWRPRLTPRSPLVDLIPFRRRRRIGVSCTRRRSRIPTGHRGGMPRVPRRRALKMRAGSLSARCVRSRLDRGRTQGSSSKASSSMTTGSMPTSFCRRGRSGPGSPPTLSCMRSCSTSSLRRPGAPLSFSDIGADAASPAATTCAGPRTSGVRSVARRCRTGTDGRRRIETDRTLQAAYWATGTNLRHLRIGRCGCDPIDPDGRVLGQLVTWSSPASILVSVRSAASPCHQAPAAPALRHPIRPRPGTRDHLPARSGPHTLFRPSTVARLVPTSTGCAAVLPRPGEDDGPIGARPRRTRSTRIRP